VFDEFCGKIDKFRRVVVAAMGDCGTGGKDHSLEGRYLLPQVGHLPEKIVTRLDLGYGGCDGFGALLPDVIGDQGDVA